MSLAAAAAGSTWSWGMLDAGQCLLLCTFTDKTRTLVAHFRVGVDERAQLHSSRAQQSLVCGWVWLSGRGKEKTPCSLPEVFRHKALTRVVRGPVGALHCLGAEGDWFAHATVAALCCCWCQECQQHTCCHTEPASGTRTMQYNTVCEVVIMMCLVEHLDRV
jgi:hypothetical protein